MKSSFFDTAKAIFEHTALAEARVSDSINLAMLDMVDREAIEAANLLVTNALGMGERVWLCSDLHFCHRNIVEYSDRPFISLTQMNTALLAMLHKVPEDELLILVGDIALGDYEEALIWLKNIKRKVVLVVGNHDMNRGDGRYRYKKEHGLFEAVVPFLFWEEAHMRRLALVTHYPITVPGIVRTGGIVNYHGHLHQKLLQRTVQIHYVNVGYDVAHGLTVI